MARLFDDGSSESLYSESGLEVTAPPATLACWFNCDDEDDNPRNLMCVSDKDSNTRFMRLFLDGGESPNALLAHYEGDDGTGSWATTSPWSINTWHHGAGVFPSTASRIAYLDGANKVTESTAEDNLTGTETWAVGVLKRLAPIQYFSGLIAEAGWWDVALTDDEIAILAEGYSPLLVRPQSLKHYLPLIRDDDDDLIAGVQMTKTGTPIIGAHPRVYYPRK